MRDRLLVFGIGWTAAFAAMHLYWAAGGTAGLPTDGPRLSDRPAFLVYDLATVVILLAAMAVAGALLRRPGPRLARLVLAGSVLALLRGVIGVVQDVGAAAAGHGVAVDAIWDGWFVVAGVVFLAATPHRMALRPMPPSWSLPRLADGVRLRRPARRPS